MLIQIIGRYEVVIVQDDTYLLYAGTSDPAFMRRVVRVDDILDVVERRRAAAPVRAYDITTMKSVQEAMETGETVSTWNLVAVELDSLFGGDEEGMYLVGDAHVCISSYDLTSVLDAPPVGDAEQGLDGLLLKNPRL